MNTRELILKLMDDSNIGYTEMGKRIGMSRQAIWQRLHGNKSNDVFTMQTAEMVKVCGYRLMLVPEDVKNPTGSIEIRGNKGGDTDDRANICKGNER